MKAKFLYHSTSYFNLVPILETCYIKQNVGHRIAGYDGNFVSVSDILSQYLAIIFGNNIIEFKAKNLFGKNNLKPRIYDCTETDFNDMPFEEAEWISDKIKFSYKDINRIICIPMFLTEKSNLKDVCCSKGIRLEYINSAEKLPNYNLDFFVNAYKERIKNAN